MNRKILKRPVVTEKSMSHVTDGVYTFEVALDANKKEIAEAVHAVFEVDVDRVRTQIRPGKNRRVLRTRQRTRTPAKKYAYVILVEDQRIAGFDDLLEVEEDES